VEVVPFRESFPTGGEKHPVRVRHIFERLEDLFSLSSLQIEAIADPLSVV
jgi:hypothetical protein